MGTYVFYSLRTGAVQSVCCILHEDEAGMIAANTPVGCAALMVDPASPVLSDQKGWGVANGVLLLVPATAAELLAAAQATQTAAIEAAYQNATYVAPIAYMGTTFFTDAESQHMLMGAVIGFQAAGGTPSGFAWWDTTNTAVPMTLAELQGLYQATLLGFNTAFVKRKGLLAQVAAASTVAGVQAIVW